LAEGKVKGKKLGELILRGTKKKKREHKAILSLGDPPRTLGSLEKDQKVRRRGPVKIPKTRWRLL